MTQPSALQKALQRQDQILKSFLGRSAEGRAAFVETVVVGTSFARSGYVAAQYTR